MANSTGFYTNMLRTKLYWDNELANEGESAHSEVIVMSHTDES